MLVNKINLFVPGTSTGFFLGVNFSKGRNIARRSCARFITDRWEKIPGSWFQFWNSPLRSCETCSTRRPRCTRSTEERNSL